MKKNQSGFGVVEVLVLLLIVGLIATIGWLTYERNFKKDSSVNNSSETKNNQQEIKSDEKIPEGFKKYTNSSDGVSVAYPNSWLLDETVIPNGYGRQFVAFKSPDFRIGETSIGGDGVLEGASVSISKGSPMGVDVQEDYKSPKFAADVTSLTLDGEKAIRWFVSYEGPPNSFAVVYKNNLQYMFVASYPQNGGTFEEVRDKYEPIFLAILSTLKFL